MNFREFRSIAILLLISVLCLTSAVAFGQLSSDDIRHAAGHGPYPIYLTGSWSKSSSLDVFKDLNKAFTAKHSGKNRTALHGFEINLGWTINEDNLLGNKIYGVSMESGYQRVIRRVRNDSLDFFFQEEVAAVRIGWRPEFYYPIGMHFQVGPVLYHRTEGRLVERDNGIRQSERLGEPFGHISGLDFRGRLTVMDPAGTTGGLGMYFEWKFHHNFKRRSVQVLYDLIGLDNVSDQRWNYWTFSIGVMVPFALRIQ
ncbi:MAG: hypothetical protein OEQ53_05670 [Saprospiraceae bacterium]|nr:hypothetical protein [Saprospiraceae bacterium]